MNTNKKQKLILFDFDGVIADTKYEILKNARIASNNLGYRCNPTLDILRNLKKMEFEELGLRIGIGEKDVSNFVEIVLDLFSNSKVIPEIFDGIYEILINAKSDNYICIITGNSAKTVNRFLKKHKLDGCVHAIYDKNYPGSKADKVIQAMNKFEKTKTSIYFVGDAISDIIAAKRAGITSIAVSWGNQNIELMKQENPNFIVDTPIELMALFNIK